MACLQLEVHSGRDQIQRWTGDERSPFCDASYRLPCLGQGEAYGIANRGRAAHRLKAARIGWEKPGVFWWILGLLFAGCAVWAMRKRTWRTLLGFWGVALAVAFVPWERAISKSIISASWAAPDESWVALRFLLAWPLLWIWGARRGLDRLLHRPSREAQTPWQIAMSMLRRNARATIGLRVLGLAYMIAFLAPVLSTYDPERLPRAGVVLKALAPGSTVYVLGDTRRGEVYCSSFEIDPEDSTKLLLDRVIATKSIPHWEWS